MIPFLLHDGMKHNSQNSTQLSARKVEEVVLSILERIEHSFALFSIDHAPFFVPDCIKSYEYISSSLERSAGFTIPTTDELEWTSLPPTWTRWLTFSRSFLGWK
jgi:hypothetical protein